MASGIRDLEKERYWQEIIDRQKQSGKSIPQFCKDEGINDRQFYYWQSILTKRQKAKNHNKPLENKIEIPFVPLNVPDNFELNSKQDASDQIEISKIVLRMSSTTDKATLACILQSLEKA